ncbi:MAG: c-type cytochrome [Kiloniellaceae bacterium]|nr:c-type cytochrome [Kiloniellaceae bacterium]
MTLRRCLVLATVLAGPDGPSTAVLGQNLVAEGETLFRARCAACHSLEPGQSRIGPALAGLAGRTAGIVEGARYSSALRDSGLVWNAETLEAFLANPREAVPGTPNR